MSGPNRDLDRKIAQADAGGPDATWVALVAAVLAQQDDELRIPFSSLQRARWVSQLEHLQLQVEQDDVEQQLVVKLVDQRGQEKP